MSNAPKRAFLGRASTRGGSLFVVGFVVCAFAMSGQVPASAGSGASEKPMATEVGVSATEIRIAVVADVDNPIIPGIFQGSVDGVRGAVDYLNSKAGGGGVAGRKIVVDFIDSKLNANASRNATITACGQDLAMIGTSAVALTSVEDIVNCPDMAGNPTGLPDIPAVDGDAEGCAPLAYPVNPSTSVCATVTQNPQTYQVNQGAFTYLAKQHKGLHGSYVYGNDTKGGAVTGEALIHASTGAGIKADTSTGLSALSPQSAYTPIIQQMKQNNSNYQYSIGSIDGEVLLRSEAQLQGLTDPNIVWMCTSACYDKTIHDHADVMEGSYTWLSYLPFEEAKSNATLKKFVKYVGADKVNGYAVYGWAAGLAFGDALKAAAKNGINGITRSSLLQGIQTLSGFVAGGMLAKTDIAHHKTSPCTMLTQFKNDKFVRVWPTKKGTFDCASANYSVFKADYTGS